MPDGGRRLVVGVPALLTRLPPATSVGRIWSHGLGRLAGEVEIRVVEPRRWSRRAPRGIDVHLVDGHQGPIEARAPVVAHLHEAAWADPELRPLLDPAFVLRYEGPSAAAARAAAQVLTVSESSRGQIVATYGVDPARVHVAPNGVDHAVYHPGVAAAEPILARAGLPGLTQPYVLFVSTVHPRKNLAALREALALLAAAGRPHPLVLVAGQAADRADSAALTEAALAPIPGIDSPPVNLAGATDDEVARLMAGAGAFCLPSLMEGFGMAVAESLACGTPVVVSDRGSLPEVAGPGGIVTGIDAASIADGLHQVLGDPERRAALAAAGRRHAAAFTWEAMSAVWLEALRAAVDDGPG